MPHGFKLLIATQFLSALADNALLILTIAWLEALAFSPWWVPLLKWFFIAAYVILAPWVGPLADRVPKPRLMAWMNAVKLMGAASLLSGANRLPPRPRTGWSPNWRPPGCGFGPMPGLTAVWSVRPCWGWCSVVCCSAQPCSLPCPRPGSALGGSGSMNGRHTWSALCFCS